MRNLLLVLFFFLSLFAAADDSGSYGEGITWKYVESTQTLTISGNGAMKDCKYNQQYATIPWYSYHSKIVRIVIEEGVTNIGDCAFQDCNTAIKVIIPETVKIIGQDALNGCSSLTSITIPNSVSIIGGRAFYGCSSLISVIIPNSVNTIGFWAFEGCSSLTTVTIPNSLTTIEDYMFAECSSLTSVTIPNSVTSIGGSAFSDCSSLASVTIPNSVTTIGANAFRNCFSLTSFKIPDGVTIIEDEMLSGCISLTSVDIPNSVTTIGENAFQACNSLTSITIPNGVTTIRGGAFHTCNNLTSINFPNGVTTIGESAFYGCIRLISLTIPNSVTTIGESAFSGCYNVATLKLPDELQIIKKATFKGCNRLMSITIPATVEYIYQEAFSGCNALESVNALSNTPPFLYDNSFSNYSLTLNVPKGCKEAYQSAQGWKNFKNIIAVGDIYKLAYMIDGEEYASYDIEEGKPITPEPTPSKEGYTFSGWSEIPETMPAHDVIVTGSFIKNGGPYSLKCILDGVGYTQDVPSNTPIKEKLGEIVLAHYKEIPLIKEVSQLSSPCTDNVEGRDLGALLDRNPSTFWHSDWHSNYIGGLHYFQVEIEDGDDEVYDSLIFEFTRRASKKDHITEWSVRGTNSYNAEMEDCKELLHAYTPFVVNTETITSEPFIHKGYKYLRFYCLNSYPDYHTFFHLSEFQLHPYQTTPIKKGHTFTGWTLENGEQTPETMPDYDITVIGSFVVNKYKLIYQVDGEEYKTYEVEYGANITAEAVPVKEGYTFSGWSEIPETMPAHDVVVTGIFAKNNEQCATPTISYANGKLKYECKTPNVEFVTEITDDDIKTHIGDEVALTAAYTISVIAKAEGYKPSEPATATLCWIDAEPYAEGTKEAEDNVTEVRATPVLIQTEGNTISVQGAAEGTEISVYNTAGIKLGSTIANEGITKLKTSLSSGSTAIVKIGEKAVKVLVK